MVVYVNRCLQHSVREYVLDNHTALAIITCSMNLTLELTTSLYNRTKMQVHECVRSY